MQDEYRTHHQCMTSSANTIKPCLRRAASFISIKALGTWQFPCHTVCCTSTAVPQNGAFLNKESNLVLLEPARHHFLLSSFLPKREVNLLWVYSGNYSTKFTTTTTDTFLLFLWIPTFPLTSSGQHTSKCFSIVKAATLLARWRLRDPEIILKPVTNYLMKSPLNSSQVCNSYVSDWALRWTGKIAKAQNRDHQQLPVPVQEIKATCHGIHERKIHNMAEVGFKHNSWFLTQQNKVTVSSSRQVIKFARFETKQSHCHPLLSYSKEGKTKVLVAL